jgi:signal transduction histidine kinase
VEVAAIAGELRQVFSNLLNNSLDAIEEGGTVKLRISPVALCTETGNRRVRIMVADNGRGINKTSRPSIFEPFFTTKGTLGTGLGLWVTKQIVDKHHGIIRVRSSCGGAMKGTTFSVVLPVTASSVGSAEPTTPATD